MDGDVENDYVSGGHGYMKIHIIYQYNGFKPLINSNNINYIYINANLNDGDVSRLFCLINIHTLSQFNSSSWFIEMDWDVENGNVSVGLFFMNSHTIYKANNQNCIIYSKKRDEMFPTHLEWKILDYRMMLTLMLCYLYPHFINIPIWNAIMNIIPSYLMVKCDHQNIHQFQCWLHPLLLQWMMKYDNYKIHYIRRSSINMFLKLKQELLVRKWCDEVTGQIVTSQNMALCNTWILLKDKCMKEVVSELDTINNLSIE